MLAEAEEGAVSLGAGDEDEDVSRIDQLDKKEHRT
jgi:hypothetical protein